MILLLHIVLGIATIALGLSALLSGREKHLQYQIVTFVSTIASGVLLGILQPATIQHLCISGALFSVLSIALHIAARQAYATSELK